MADIVQPMRFEIDVKSGLVTKPQRTILMKGDKNANRIIAALTEEGKPLDLTGATVTGRFIRPPDGAEVPLTGEAVGNEARVTLIDQCYTAEGFYEASVILTMGDVRRTVLSISGTVHSAGGGAYVDVSGVIPSMDDIIAQFSTMRQVTAAAQTAANRATEAAQRAEDLQIDASGMAGDSNRLGGVEASEYVRAGHVLTVGSGGRFATINAAIEYAKTICSVLDRVLIKIMPGVYEEEIILNPNPGIDFEGSDWSDTLIIYPSVYPNAPLFTCGQGSFRNLTFYSNCPDGEASPSYGVHIEYQNVPDAGGVIRFANCKLQSRMSAAIGAGLGANSIVYMTDCVCISETANAVYVHGYPANDVPGQTFTAERCDFRALSGGAALHVDDVNGIYGVSGSQLTIECVGCRGSKMALRTAEATYQGFIPNTGDVRLSPYSKGNEFVGANYGDLYNVAYVVCMRAANGLLFVPWDNASAFAVALQSVLDSAGNEVVGTVSLHSAHKNGFLLTTTSVDPGPYLVQAVVYPG